MTYARVAIVLCLYLLEQCLDPVFQTLIKTCNFVTFYEFLIHLGMHHTMRACKAIHVWEAGRSLSHSSNGCWQRPVVRSRRIALLISWEFVQGFCPTIAILTHFSMRRKMTLGASAAEYWLRNATLLSSMAAGVGWQQIVDSWSRISHTLMPACHPMMVGFLDTLKALLMLASSVVKHVHSMFCVKWKQCFSCANIVSMDACSVLVNGVRLAGSARVQSAARPGLFGVQNSLMVKRCTLRGTQPSPSTQGGCFGGMGDTGWSV